MCLCGGVKIYIITCEKCMFWCEKGHKWIKALGSCKTHYWDTIRHLKTFLMKYQFYFLSYVDAILVV